MIIHVHFIREFHIFHNRMMDLELKCLIVVILDLLTVRVVCVLDYVVVYCACVLYIT